MAALGTPDFGTLLRRYRLAAGLTQEALAERASVSARAVASLEQGTRRHPHRYTVEQLADALGLAGDVRAGFAAAAGSPRPVAGEPDRGPQDPTPSRWPSPNLPVELTSFIGREAEAAEVERLLATTRLLTLIGAGGVGKTRLALRVAAAVQATFPDGVWLAELAALVDPDLVPSAVAGALAVRERPGAPLVSSLVEHLRDRDVLLVLDNCEHLVAACAGLVETLLGACPRLRVLATSREVLGVPGEIAWRVPSLSLPGFSGSAAPGVGSAPGLDGVAGSAAVRLFVERARVAAPGFALTEQNAPAVAQICHQLDGIPLAIELAAARLRLLTPEQIAARLDDRFRLLTGGGRTTVRRHQTLRALVDWSFDLLSERERLLFVRLTVFAGGWTLEAAEGVCAGNGIDEADVLDLLSQLVDKSLVVVSASADGGNRYGLLETLRQYGLDQLNASGEGDATRQRHAAFFADLAEAAYGERLARAKEWLGRLETEFDNLRAALDWAKVADQELHLQVAGALAWFWKDHCHATEGRHRLAEALAGATGTSEILARALAGAGQLAAWHGYAAAGRAQMEASVELWRELGDAAELALAIEGLGWVDFIGGETEAARRHFEESLGLQRELGDERRINQALLAVCQVLVSEGDFAVAKRMAEEALARAVSLRDRKAESFAQHYLGDSALFTGSFARAEHHYGESLAAASDYGDRFWAAIQLQGVAMAAAGRGQWARALRLGGAAEAEFEAQLATVSPPFWTAALERFFGRAKEELGSPRAAEAWAEGRAWSFDQAVRSALGDGEPNRIERPGRSVRGASDPVPNATGKAGIRSLRLVSGRAEPARDSG